MAITFRSVLSVVTDVPIGATVVPIGNAKILLHCADVWDKSYTDLSEILADTATLQKVIDSANAIDYLVRSITWVSTIVADQSAMAFIGASNYASNTLLADSAWKAPICNSTYFESVLNAKVPVMTSATSPSGIVRASSAQGGADGYKVFDGNDSTYWNSTEGTAYVSYQFPTAISPYKISAYVASNNQEVTILGSSDGSNWNTLVSAFTLSGGSRVNKLIENNNACAYYKASVTKLSGNTAWLHTLQFYGRKDI